MSLEINSFPVIKLTQLCTDGMHFCVRDEEMNFKSKNFLIKKQFKDRNTSFYDADRT